MVSAWHRFFETQGFATFVEGLAAGEVDELLDEFSHLNRKPGGAGIRHVLKYPKVSDLARDPRFLGIAREIRGPEAFPKGFAY